MAYAQPPLIVSSAVFDGGKGTLVVPGRCPGCSPRSWSLGIKVVAWRPVQLTRTLTKRPGSVRVQQRPVRSSHHCPPALPFDCRRRRESVSSQGHAVGRSPVPRFATTPIVASTNCAKSRVRGASADAPSTREGAKLARFPEGGDLASARRTSSCPSMARTRWDRLTGTAEWTVDA